MNVFMVQCNPTVGHVSYNLEKIETGVQHAINAEAHVVVFPECILTGYPLQDILFTTELVESLTVARRQLVVLSMAYPKLLICVGMPTFNAGQWFNSVCCYLGGEQVALQHKTYLPNHDVFDEKRYFSAATSHEVYSFMGYKIAFSICEDAWIKQHNRVITTYCEQAPDLMINLSASPFDTQKEAQRLAVFSHMAQALNCPVVMVNQVGATDSLIFDGGSMVFDRQGHCVKRLSLFRECQASVVLSQLQTYPHFQQDHTDEARMALLYQALILGIQDYVKKTGFESVVLGLSGGIDSAVTCALAVQALGGDRVVGLAMPSLYSSPGSVADAAALAQACGCRYHVVPISDAFGCVTRTLAPVFVHQQTDVTEENIQARLRGMLVMATANKFNALALATGNKSELALGFCTLYGDMCGAVAVLGDILKTDVYKLAHYINAQRPLIPLATITKAPSAELRPDQKDEDTLPPYQIIDVILAGYLEEGLSVADLVGQGISADHISFCLSKLKQHEFKRQQSAFPLRVSKKAFGVGRRFPIAAVYS